MFLFEWPDDDFAVLRWIIIDQLRDAEAADKIINQFFVVFIEECNRQLSFTRYIPNKPDLLVPFWC